MSKLEPEWSGRKRYKYKLRYGNQQIFDRKIKTKGQKLFEAEGKREFDVRSVQNVTACNP